MKATLIRPGYAPVQPRCKIGMPSTLQKKRQAAKPAPSPPALVSNLLEYTKRTVCLAQVPRPCAARPFLRPQSMNRPPSHQEMAKAAICHSVRLHGGEGDRVAAGRLQLSILSGLRRARRGEHGVAGGAALLPAGILHRAHGRRRQVEVKFVRGVGVGLRRGVLRVTSRVCAPAQHTPCCLQRPTLPCNPHLILTYTIDHSPPPARPRGRAPACSCVA